jgi:hypothetical protein
MEALARGASGESTRVAVLLVDGDTLRGFSDFGYVGTARPADVSLDSFPALAKTVADRQRLTLAPASGRIPDVPAFMRPSTGNSGIVSPIVVASAAVALVYAEGLERQDGSASGSLWTEHVEVLVRHASSRLENVTSRRTVEVLTSSR